VAVQCAQDAFRGGDGADLFNKVVVFAPRACIEKFLPARVDFAGARSTCRYKAVNEHEEAAMRFMVIVPASPESEAGEMPSTKLLEAMNKYNQELVSAGVMLAGDGLHPSSKGARVRFDGGERTVIDGPFTETKELIAGYWIWECASRDEAIEWLKRAPFDGGTEIELRQVFESEDFGDQLTPELREAEARMREQTARQS
jgi:hypothetical protein